MESRRRFYLERGRDFSIRDSRGSFLMLTTLPKCETFPKCCRDGASGDRVYTDTYTIKVIVQRNESQRTTNL